MSDRTDPAALKKRLKTLEAQATEAQRTIDELKSRDALKTQFLSNISHDLRTPLAAIITHAEILREGMLGQLNVKQRDSVSGIVNGGQQLLDMIDEILTYVRGASDQVTLVRTEFSITELVDQVRLLNQALAAKKHLTIERRRSAADPRGPGQAEARARQSHWQRHQVHPRRGPDLDQLLAARQERRRAVGGSRRHGSRDRARSS